MAPDFQKSCVVSIIFIYLVVVVFQSKL